MTADQFHQKYGTSSPSQATPTPKGGGMDWIPGVAGTVGQVLGGLGGAALGGLGGAAVPVADLTGVPEVAGGIAGERIGQTAGGAVGQGAGEWLRETLTGQKADAGHIANNAGQGVLWAQVPGGKMAEGVVNPLLKMGAKALIRGGGGALIGGGTKAMQNVQDEKPIGEGVVGSGAVSGAINAVTGGMGDYGGQLVNDINSTTVKPVANKLQELYKAAMDHAFGFMNSDYAINSGIAPKIEDIASKVGQEGILNKNTVDEMVSKTSTQAQKIQDQLKPLLSPIKVDPSDVRMLLADSFKLADSISNPAMFKKLFQLTKFSGTSNLAEVNDLKKSIGEYYDRDKTGLAKDLYFQLKKFIEEKSGNNDAVKGLNQEAQQLVQMRQSLFDFKKPGATLPGGQSPANITKSLEDARAVPTGGKTPPALTTLQGLAQILGGASFGIAGAGLGSLMGGAGTVGGGVGAGFAGRRLGQKFIENPDVLNAIAKLLNSKGMNVTTDTVKQLLLKGGAAAGGQTPH